MLALLAVLAIPGFDLNTYERPRLIKQADSVLSMEPKTIVTIVNPRSAGGPHDWSSEGDYWWPDPSNPGGPYIQRDGMTNPDNFVGHRQLMLDFVRAFDALAAAYKVTGDERYAAAAVRHLDAWFVAPATRMNPNLQYAQAIQGVSTGRGTGVIDTVHFAEVALGVEALRGSKALSPQEDAAVTGWFRDYLHWLMTSKNGLDEMHATNNHGTCWVLQASAFADLTGNQEALAAFRKRFKEVLLPNQMAPDGSFPQELLRTKSYGYSIFDLDAMTGTAQVLSTPDDNLLTTTLSDGRSVIKGIQFLAPYIADKGAWITQVRRPAKPKRVAPKSDDSGEKHDAMYWDNHGASMEPESAKPTDPLEKPDVMYWDNWPVRQPFLIFGALATGREDWVNLWKTLDPDPQVEEIRRNFIIRQPVLWVR